MMSNSAMTNIANQRRTSQPIRGLLVNGRQRDRPPAARRFYSTDPARHGSADRRLESDA